MSAAVGRNGEQTGELKGRLRPQAPSSRPRLALRSSAQRDGGLTPSELTAEGKKSEKRDYPWVSTVRHRFETFENFKRWLKEKNEADRPRVFAWVWTVEADDPEDEETPATSDEEFASTDDSLTTLAAEGIPGTSSKCAPLPPVHTAHIALNADGGLVTCSVVAAGRRDMNKWLTDMALPRQD